MSLSVDYDRVAAEYDNRYAQSDYSGVKRALVDFVLSGDRSARLPILEVGCGTGHWLAVLRDANIRAVGLDSSAEMLSVAADRGRDRLLVRAGAEDLPFASASFGRVVCINALHHFRDQASFLVEARRVLRPHGAVLTVGLDPHAGGRPVVDLRLLSRGVGRRQAALPICEGHPRLDGVGWLLTLRNRRGSTFAAAAHDRRSG